MARHGKVWHSIVMKTSTKPMTPAMPRELLKIARIMRPPAHAITFDGEVWRALVRGRLQRPEFNSRGAALAFAEAAARGARKEEPFA